jgi:hypothetical protein
MPYENKINVQQRTIVSTKLFVMINGSSVTTVDNVLNTLTVLLNNERDVIPLDNKPATNYLKALNVIEEIDQNKFKITDREACSQINQRLSDCVDSIFVKCDDFIKSI